MAGSAWGYKVQYITRYLALEHDEKSGLEGVRPGRSG